MTQTPIDDAAALLESVADRSITQAGDDLLSPWATFGTRATLLATLLTSTAQPSRAQSSGSILDDLHEARRLLTSTGPGNDLPLGDLITARRWLSELVAEVPET